MSKSRARFVALEVLLARRNLDVDEQAIKAGRVLVDGRVVSNPAARVRADASVRVQTRGAPSGRREALVRARSVPRARRRPRSG